MSSAVAQLGRASRSSNREGRRIIPASRYTNDEAITVNVIASFSFNTNKIYPFFAIFTIKDILMSHFVYILYSSLTDRYYIGSTSDTEKRILRHNAGATPSTKPGRPWKMVYNEICTSKTEALKRENYLKRMKSRQYIENLISIEQRSSSAG